MEVEYGLFESVEVALSIILRHHLLELRQGPLRLSHLGQFDPQVVVYGGRHLRVLVHGVTGAQDAVDGPLVGVGAVPDTSLVKHSHLALVVRTQPEVTVFGSCGRLRSYSQRSLLV